jgi:hypothetical protein
MKTHLMLLILAITFFLCTNITAQNLVNSTVPDHAPYAGTWIGVEGNDSLIVLLELKDLYFEPYKKSFKVLYGTYSYIYQTVRSKTKVKKSMIIL